MGIFDFFKKGSGSQPPGPPVDKKVAGPGRVVADKHAQAYDRADAIQQLAELKSVEAATALLKRFSFAIDPSITDQEEKEMAFEAIVACGVEAVPAVVKHCAKAELITWPLKIMRELLDDDAYRKELLTMLDKQDVEYSRNVQPKLRILGALSEVMNEEARLAVEAFLDDVNEEVRFAAVETTFSHDDEACLEPLVELLEREESVRIKNKVAGGVDQRSWAFSEPLRERARKALRDAHEYDVNDDGTVTHLG